VGLERLIRVRSQFISTMILLVTVSAWARPAETEHLNVQLVSDTDSVQPGTALLVGLHFAMEKNWHIYWKNPGDSGEPPRVRWSLPLGFQAGELQWPAPARLGSGSVIDYGYERPVLLFVEMQTPENLTVGSRLTLSADVRWLVCKDICMPGKTNVTLSLPVRTAPGSASASHVLFRDARSRTPKPMPSTWRTDVTSEKDDFVLTIRGADVARVSFFPLEADQIDNAARQTLTTLPDSLRLTLKKSEQLLKTPAMLDGVLELSTGRSYTVSAPVRALPERSAPR
jgi:DsbC/DsbD-like thiol-disulfide interchange protein